MEVSAFPKADCRKSKLLPKWCGLLINPYNEDIERSVLRFKPHGSVLGFNQIVIEFFDFFGQNHFTHSESCLICSPVFNCIFWSTLAFKLIWWFFCRFCLFQNHPEICTVQVALLVSGHSIHLNNPEQHQTSIFIGSAWNDLGIRSSW